MYKIKYSKQAIKTLKKMPKHASDRIFLKLKEVAGTSDQIKNVKVLKGTEAFRLRVGDWRVIYTFNRQSVEIWVIKVASRGKIYK